MSSTSKNSTLKFWVFWLLTMIVGWAVVQYVGIYERNTTLNSWGTVFSLVFRFLINGALIGGIIGLFYWGIFRVWTKNSQRWGLTTFLGYAIGSPLGFLAAVVISWVIAKLNGIELLAGSTSSFLFMPLALTMILSGGFVAFVQVFALQGTFLNITWKDRALWVFGSSLSWGIGFILANLAWGIRFSTSSQSAMVGLVVSIMTGSILYILLSANYQVEAT